MAVGSTINWSPQVKQLNLFSLPFLMPDYAAIDALVQGDVGREMFKLIEKAGVVPLAWRSEEHTSELQSLMRISYAVFCLKKKNNNKRIHKASQRDYIRF